jgi:predicted TIM-barrel fold metal-dependent hydrolase
MNTLIPMPANACDCHAHVFGPYERYPLAEDRTYSPAESPREVYLDMLDTHGFARGVLVHAGACGWNHGATLDALRAAPTRLRGIAVPPTDIADSALQELQDAGFRGARFTQIIGRGGGKPVSGTLNLDDLQTFAPRLRALGWHAQLWANCELVAARAAELRALKIPLVLDHLAYVDVLRGVEDASFRTLLGLVRDGIAFVKLTVFRNSKTGAPYADVRPFHDALIAANPAQMLWGSDFPFLGMTGAQRPTVAGLLGLLGEWAQDESLRQQILSRNPARVYGFD